MNAFRQQATKGISQRQRAVLDATLQASRAARPVQKRLGRSQPTRSHMFSTSRCFSTMASAIKSTRVQVCTNDQSDTQTQRAMSAATQPNAAGDADSMHPDVIHFDHLRKATAALLQSVPRLSQQQHGLRHARGRSSAGSIAAGFAQATDFGSGEKDHDHDHLIRWWQEAVHLLKGWSRYEAPSPSFNPSQSNKSTDAPNHPPDIDIICCFQIMNQMHQIITQVCPAPQDGMVDPYVLDHFFTHPIHRVDSHLLNNIVWKWNKVWSQRQPRSSRQHQQRMRDQRRHPAQRQRDSIGASKKPNDSSLDLWTPSKLVEQLDKYHRCSLIEPNVRTYNVIVDTTTLFHPEDVDEGIPYAESMVHRMLEVSRNTNESMPMLIDAITIGTIMKAWLKARSQETPEKVEYWFKTLHSLWEEDYQHQQHQQDHAVQQLLRSSRFVSDSNVQNQISTLLQPNRVHYSIAMQAWANAGYPNKAQALMQEMMSAFHLYRRREQWNLARAVCPDTVLFNSLLSAWAKSNQHKNQAPQHAQKIIQRMNEIQAILSGDGIHHDGFDSNDSVNDDDDDDDDATSMADELSSAMKFPEAKWNAQLDVVNCEPDQYTLSNILVCWTRSGLPNAVDKAEELLEEMERTWASGESPVGPNIVAYNTIMMGHARNGNEEKAQKLFKKIVQLEKQYLLSDQRHYGLVSADNIPRPDTMTYNSLLQAWSNSKRTEAPDQAMRILDRMVANNSVRPDAFTFAGILKCWYKVGAGRHSKHHSANMHSPLTAAQTGHDVLHSMQSTYNVRPNTICYNAVLQAWYHVARTDGEMAVQRSVALLHEMLQESVVPDEYTLGWLLETIRSDKKSSAITRWNRAQQIVHVMSNAHVSPNRKSRKLLERLERHARAQTLLAGKGMESKGN